eukprot:CAMPEP_0182451334 /NCGR_PEP_ID=MMETSP1172-20130603/43664_1 /TAXON_ID=708627 /ORGANISM="Timspurckia oligopyrenoides, Strain CCMP3278" /LENGTH=271 /DNA_ID=CAMNT_0024649103 /DNA_START=848 /DNA_END=1663 /DNA_ORIENTATION=-
MTVHHKAGDEFELIIGDSVLYPRESGTCSEEFYSMKYQFKPGSVKDSEIGLLKLFTANDSDVAWSTTFHLIYSVKILSLFVLNDSDAAVENWFLLFTDQFKPGSVKDSEIGLLKLFTANDGVLLLSNDNGTTAETYQDRIQSGIQLVHNTYESEKLVSAIAFGDLHLNEIVNWRKQFLNQLAPELLFPLFREDAGSNYPALVDELKMSQVECIISASEFPDLIGIGDRFDEELMQKASRNGIDTFGENGEFHTLAKVWTSTSRSTALGLGK